MLARALNGLALAAAAAVASACTVVGVREGTEEPGFTVLGLVNGTEIRRYGPRLAAEVTVVTPDEVAARNAGFRPLARYIFGANEGSARIAMTIPVAQAPAQGERIAMTAPVAQKAAPGGGWTIRFFMPSAYTRETLPKPKDPEVRIVALPEETVAVRRFRGAPGAAEVAAEKARLIEALATGPWAPAGEPEAWFYDPPWTIPALRRNEVVVRVTPREPSQPPA